MPCGEMMEQLPVGPSCLFLLFVVFDTPSAIAAGPGRLVSESGWRSRPTVIKTPIQIMQWKGRPLTILFFYPANTAQWRCNPKAMPDWFPGFPKMPAPPSHGVTVLAPLGPPPFNVSSPAIAHINLSGMEAGRREERGRSCAATRRKAQRFLFFSSFAFFGGGGRRNTKLVTR